MGVIKIVIFATCLLCSVDAKKYEFDAYMMPIVNASTSFGDHGLERVDEIFAQIYPRHNLPRAYYGRHERVNFSRSGDIEIRFQSIRAFGDERGHLVASQFSGPPRWYNLSPQNARVNRHEGFFSLSHSWFEAECEVRQFLHPGANRYVNWRVEMDYNGTSNRPYQYHLMVNFFDNGKEIWNIDTTIDNPTLKDDSSFWICKRCRTSKRLSKGDEMNSEQRLFEFLATCKKDKGEILP